MNLLRLSRALGMVCVATLGIPLAVAQEVSVPVSSWRYAELPLGQHSALSVGVDFRTVNTVQWHFENTAIPGATNTILRFHPAVREHSGRYFVVGMGAAQSFTGQTAVITVKAFRPTLVELGPARQETSIGNPLLLSLAVGGAPPPAVQWYQDGAVLVGETNGSLFLPRLTPNQAGRYHAVATNEAGADTSDVFLVTVRRSPPTWSRSPGDREAVEDTLVVLTAEATAGPPPSEQAGRNRGGNPFAATARGGGSPRMAFAVSRGPCGVESELCGEHREGQSGFESWAHAGGETLSASWGRQPRSVSVGYARFSTIHSV